MKRLLKYKAGVFLLFGFSLTGWLIGVMLLSEGYVAAGFVIILVWLVVAIYMAVILEQQTRRMKRQDKGGGASE